jgi:hypothetical protein
VTIEVLKKLVFENIKQNAVLAEKDFNGYVEKLTQTIMQADEQKNLEYLKEYDKCQNRIADLDKLIQKIYEDSVFGIISQERFKSMSASIEKEQQNLKARCLELETYVQKGKNAKNKSIQFAKLISQYVDFEDFNAEVLNTLIEKITINEIPNLSTKEICIYYRFIGNISVLEHTFL